MTILYDTPEDTVLADRLRNEFRWRRRLNSLNCVLEVRTGAVTLSKSIASPRDRTRAQTIALQTPGVTSVRFAGPPAEHAAEGHILDEELEHRVTDALAATAHVHTSSPGTRISVRARHGMVILRGHVDARYERDAAVRVTESLFGVTRVVSRLRVRANEKRLEHRSNP